MSDPRETPFDGRVAHVSLRGTVEAEAFVEGEWRTVGPAVAPLLAAPGGSKEREMLTGARFCVLSETGGVAYGFREEDGYCGYVASRALYDAAPATHRVSVRETYWKPSPDLKAYQPEQPLYFGSRLEITGRERDWVAARLPDGETAYLPHQHVQPLDMLADDPVEIATLFLGTPYLWGGNSGRGIDCSGLVQAAMLACGVPCPGDSDQQEERLGDPLAEDADVKRGDLIFWRGHVGFVADPETLLHANGHHMAVARESLTGAIARIAESEGPVTSRRRVTLPRG